MFEQNTACVKINLNNIKHNYMVAKNCCVNSHVLAVVKANAYGHGANDVALALQNQCDCRHFAVARLDEAIALRKGGIDGMILVLSYTNPEQFKYLIEYNISQTVLNLQYLKELAQFAQQNGKINIHLKIDSGMNRIGFYWQNADELAVASKILCEAPNLLRQGIFTHFAQSEDTNCPFTKAQIENFLYAKKLLKNNGTDFEITHSCNSAAIFNFSEAHFDMVRFGIGLYGYGTGNNLLPAMEFSAPVISLHPVKKGMSISYNQTFVAQNDMLVATICAGYADGVTRLLSNNGNVYINSCICPIVGRVCMDMTMVDVTELCNNIRVGDRAEFFGNHISCQSVANRCNTIPYEIMCNIGNRVPRVYTDF